MLQIDVNLQVKKPAHEVFQAIIDPEKMKNYFISESTGRMEEGKELLWKFAEFDMRFPVRIGKIEKDKYISWRWDLEEKELLVEIFLKPAENNSTVVTISEKEMPNDEAGIQWLKQNTAGWANFLACLKAYLEYEINLRKGGFDFMNREY